MRLQLLTLFLLPFLFACSSTVKFSQSEKDYSGDKEMEGETFYGKASYYADKFEGRPTASGEIYSGNKLTAAHKTLPFGTIVEVTNLSNNRNVTVVINDRGPFVSGRVIDLSYKAARQLQMIQNGVVDVKVTIIEVK